MVQIMKSPFNKEKSSRDYKLLVHIERPFDLNANLFIGTQSMTCKYHWCFFIKS